jgi:hypothetical protein
MDGDVPYKPKAPPPGQPAKVVDPNAYGWRKGHWQIEVSHYLDPGPRVCVMQNGQAVEIPAKTVLGQQMYKSGDYGYISLYAWAYERETFGINFGFEGVLFSRPGEQIGSSGGPKSAAAMFGSVAPVGQMAPPAGPVAAPGPAPAPAPAAAPVYAPPPGAVAPPPPSPAPTYSQGYVPPGPNAGAVASAPAGGPPMPPPAPSAGLPPFPGR